ncbi:MAG: (2Fe-2S)-binding protein [Burkholderiales bacterium]|nr:(2Fe-2S)-binding protein [Burkholderiales bacterium]
MIRFFVNGKPVQTDSDPDTPLLWVLRDGLGLTGTKYGCGRAQCGACTVHVNGEAEFSCSVKVADVAGKRVATIEGIAASGAVAKAVKAAWIDKDVVQCGYCQPGQVMAAVALLTKNKSPSDAQIDEAMDGNLCRCGTYPRIREAVRAAATALAAKR